MFTKNRDHLFDGDVARESLLQVVSQCGAGPVPAMDESEAIENDCFVGSRSLAEVMTQETFSVLSDGQTPMRPGPCV